MNYSKILKYVLETILGLEIFINLFMLACYILDRLIWIYVSRHDKGALIHNISTFCYGILTFVALCCLMPLHLAIIIFTYMHILIGHVILPHFGDKHLKFEYVLARITEVINKRN